MGAMGPSYVSSRLFAKNGRIPNTGDNSFFRMTLRRYALNLDNVLDHVCNEIDLSNVVKLNEILKDFVDEPFFDEEAVRHVNELRRNGGDRGEIWRRTKLLSLQADFVLYKYGYYYNDIWKYNTYYNGCYIEIKSGDRTREYRVEYEGSFSYLLLDDETRITWVDRGNRQELIFPDRIEKSVYSIRWGACAYMPMESVTLPSHLKSIGYGAFMGCSHLKTIEFPESLERICSCAFAGCSLLESIVLPEGLKQIDSMAFFMCANLRTVTVQNPGAKIAKDAFRGCGQVQIIYAEKKEDFPDPDSETVTVPAGAVSIPANAYSGFTKLRSVVLPESLKKIGFSSFYRCGDLTELVIPDSVKEIGQGAFMKCKGLKRILLPAEISRIEPDTFLLCENLEELILPEHITAIGVAAFLGCASIKEIVLPEAVTEIADATFSGCERMEYVHIPDGVTKIGTRAFENCRALKELRLPGSVREIGAHAFENCVELKELRLPESVREIGDEAFKNCSALKELTIPEDIQKIGTGAFRKSGLKVLNLPADRGACDKEALDGCPKDLRIVFSQDENAEDTAEYETLFIKMEGMLLTLLPEHGEKPEKIHYEREEFFAFAREAKTWRCQFMESAHEEFQPGTKIPLDEFVIKDHKLYGIYHRGSDYKALVSFDEGKKPVHVYSGTYYFDEPGDHDSWSWEVYIRLHREL